MKNLFKKICVFLILVVVVVLGVFINSTYVYASSTSKNFYQGYSNGINFDELHNMTRLSKPSYDAPSITILVHGQAGNASHWSNDSLNSKYEFKKSENSIIEKLALSSQIDDTNVYWANFDSTGDFYLIDLNKSDDEYVDTLV